ncbi:MAG: FecR domain-containing protein [Lachnospiraceae bacterium]|nr:FecR domain-containing protein [Lachnospiraceae bacterium]
MNLNNYKMKKKKKFILWCALAALAVVMGAIAAFSCYALGENKGYRTIAVIEVEGSASVVKEGIEYKAYPGMLLQEGHELVVSGNGYVRLALDGDKYVKVESGSRVVFEVLGVLGSGKTRMKLERGALTGEVVKPLSEDEEFVVNTPNAVLAVRGTFFRIDLIPTEKGELSANVMTYGGKVSTRRVFPSGEVEEAEVLVDAGFKTTINKNEEDTIYVVGELEGAVDTTGDAILDVAPIQNIEIPDGDLIDIYYAAENGHELFVTAQEVKADIESRNIDLESTTSVYEKEAEVGADGGTKAETDVIADDSVPLAKVEENADATLESEANGEAIASEEKQSDMSRLMDGEETETIKTHVHTEVTNILEATCAEDGLSVVTCETCEEELARQVLSATGHEPEVSVYASSCTENGMETEVCTVCGETLSETILEATGHSGNVERVEPTCTQTGIETESCIVCGEILSETILEAMGHSGNVERVEPTCTETGMETESCTVCDEILSETILEAKGHTNSVTRVEGTCEAQGYERITCSDCGTLLSQTVLPIGDHRTEFVGDEFTHSRCAECGMTLVTAHSYTETELQGLTCTLDGITLYECECGYSYEETVTAEGHVRDTGNDTLCSNCGELWASLDSTCFPDAAFLAYVTQYDADGDGHLWASELSGTTTLNLAGTSSQDGGYSDLTGIKYFANLTTLNCSYNAGITELYLQNNNSLETITSYNTGLAYLEVSDAGTLRSLNVFACPIQELLLADQTSLATLNVGNCDSLAMIDISNTGISTLDVSSVESLAWLDVSGTQLTQLDATNLIQLVSLDVSGCTALETLTAEACELLGDVYLTDCTALTNVSLIGCYALESVDFSDCTQLYELNVGNTGLTSLNVSGLTALYLLGADDCTGLTTVDASGCTTLYSATFARNAQLSTVNVSGNTGMYELRLDDCTGLTSVNVQSCGSGMGNFVIYATGTGKTTDFFTGYDSGYMMFQGD